MHRMVWAFVLVAALLVLMRQWSAFITVLRQPRVLLRLFVASLLMSINWAVFIWAVTAGRIVETSMGYFINPLISVLFGVLFFSERLRRGQMLALAMATIGVLSMVVAYGALPWVSLSLAVTFSLYSVIKKTITLPATHGMTLETAFMFLPALGYLIYLESQQQGVFGADLVIDSMLILSGLLTLIPLVLFAAAAKQVSMTALGMTQYIGPFLQLGIAVFLYKEPFGFDRLLAFGLVWTALVIYSLDQINHRRRNRNARIQKPVAKSP